MQLRHRHVDDEVSESELDDKGDQKTDEAAPLISEKKPESSRSSVTDPRFNPPPPSPYKRILLVLCLVFLFWVGFKLRTALVLSKQPKVIHASRYSKEFKYRPAASPIITETLKDGRIRLRGSPPEPTSAPLPPNEPPKKNKKKKRKAIVSGKRKQRKPKA